MIKKLKKSKDKSRSPATLLKYWNTCFLELGSTKRKPFKCCDCEFTAKSRVEVRRNYSVHLSEEPFACNIPHCQFRTRFSASLYTHRKRHEREERGEIPFQCDYPGCDYKTGQKHALKVHRVGMHETQGKPFACSFSNCNFRSKWEYCARKHERTHDPDRPKPFQCPICQGSFYLNAHLQVHIMTHTKEGAHKCPHCSYSAPFLSRVNYHVRNRHLPADERKRKWPKRVPATGKQHKCSICEFSSDYMSKLNKHLAKVHRPKVEAVKKERSFGCEICDFRSDARTRLEEHMLLHSNLKPYACIVSGCEFRTKWKRNMKLHVGRVHSSGGPGEVDTVAHSMTLAAPVVLLKRLELRWS